MRNTAYVVVLAALACAAVAHAAPPKRDPAYRVTVKGVFVEQENEALAPSGGCSTGTGTRTISFESVPPLVLNASKLARAANGLVALKVTEKRSVTAGGPTCYDDANGCGSVSYTVGANGTGVGLLNGTDGRFTFFMTSIRPDPFAGACTGIDHAWKAQGTPGSSGAVSIVNVPPGQVWSTEPGGRQYWQNVTRAQLFDGKPHTIAWSDQGPDTRTHSIATYSLWWTVTLTPVP